MLLSAVPSGLLKLRLRHCLQTDWHPTATPQLHRHREGTAVSLGRQQASLAGLCPSFPCWPSSFQNSPGSFSKRPDCTALDYSFRLCTLQNQSFLFQQEFLVFIFKAKKSEVSHTLKLFILHELYIKGTWTGSFHFMRSCSFSFRGNMFCAGFFLSLFISNKNPKALVGEERVKLCAGKCIIQCFSSGKHIFKHKYCFYKRQGSLVERRQNFQSCKWPRKAHSWIPWCTEAALQGWKISLSDSPQQNWSSGSTSMSVLSAPRPELRVRKRGLSFPPTFLGLSFPIPVMMGLRVDDFEVFSNTNIQCVLDRKLHIFILEKTNLFWKMQNFIVYLLEWLV